MRHILLIGAFSAMALTSCTKEDTTAQKTLEQEKMEYQARQLDIERQKLAIEKEKIAFERAKDSIEKVEQQKAQASVARTAAAPVRERVVERTVYRNNSTASSGSYEGASDGTYTQAPQRQGISKAAKGTIIGTVGGAAAGAIINKRNRGAGAVIGGVVGGATGYTIGRAADRRDGRVQ